MFAIAPATTGTNFRALDTVALNTIAELTALGGMRNGQQAFVSGYRSAGDGGGGAFYWSSGSTATEVQGMIEAADTGGAGRWIRICDPGFVNVRWTGAAPGQTAAVNSTAISAAITFLTDDRGGELFFPSGTYDVNSTITLSVSHKPILFRGMGSSNSGQESGASVLNWTGGASIVIDVGTDIRNFHVRDLDLENNGTCTTFIRVGFTDHARISNVTMRPTTFPSTAAIVLGVGANRCENVMLDHVAIRGTAANQVGIAADRAQDLRMYRVNLVNCRMSLGIAGSMDIVNAALHGCSFNSIVGDTQPCVDVFQGRSIAFHACHFEPQDNNFAVDIHSTGTDKRGILFSGCYFSGTANGIHLINANFANCDLTVIASTTVQFANPYYLVRNLAAAKITMIGNSMNGTGATLITDKKTNSVGIGNVVNAVADPDWGIRTPVITDAGGTGTTYDVDCAAAAGQDCTIVLTSNNNYTIRNFTNTVSGQRLFVIQEGSGTATIDRTNAYLAGGVNQALGQRDAISLAKSTLFHQVSAVQANS